MILDGDFFVRECPEVSRALVGKLLCRSMPDGSVKKLRILETEAYCGESDTACHAHKGRTTRTEVLYAPAGTIYVYLCYGIHWMLNIVTGQAEQPQAVLIRACETAPGPGRLTKALDITGAFNKRNLSDCVGELWFEDDAFPCRVAAGRRIGIGYASPEDQEKPWRFILDAQ